ncbi:hypothetical protein GA0115237_112039 [Streptomyces sp. ScaeMP-6W]|nr:hypothetical protein GA0115237_112039 [Streptomyces sp. ScaeMP-6W]
MRPVRTASAVGECATALFGGPGITDGTDPHGRVLAVLTYLNQG